MELSTILFSIVIVLVTLTVYLIRSNLNYWKNRKIPCEEPHILMGNLKGLRTKWSLGAIMKNYYNKFKGSGPFAGIFIGHRPGVLALDIQLIKHILIKDFSQFADRGRYYNENSDPLTAHLFFVDGDKWRSMRNKLSPIFTSMKMRYIYPTVQKVADTFMDVLSKEVEENPIVEIRNLLSRYTVDVLGNVAFGIECSSLRCPDNKFLQLGRKSFEVTRHGPFVMTMIDSFPHLARLLGMRVTPQDIHEFFMHIIKETVEYRELNNIQRNDFLNILIDLKNTINDATGLGEISMNQLTAQVFGFFLGGFETSATTMAFALYELAQNQEIQQKLRVEVNEAFEKQDGLPMQYETLMNMSYMEQVLAETLRKYPPIPVLNRRALCDYQVYGDPQFVIEKGTPIFIPVLGIQYDPEIYPNPELFDPERFSPELIRKRESVEWLPFGNGPRNCIGMRFAKMQSRLGIANILRRYRLRVYHKTDIPMEFSVEKLTLVPKNPIYLRLEAL
ncbi:cytochrome P450 6A1-like [Haematobia irritans]|uniref:cytochrome P450 6A1-like n=1 Tax=Haematobia irritans TaxID=7368 RepID=UPI003F50C434